MCTIWISFPPAFLFSAAKILRQWKQNCCIVTIALIENLKQVLKFQFDRTWFYQITKWVYSSCVDYDNIFASSEKHVDFATCTCINHSGRWCISAASTCTYLSSGSYIWSIFKERIIPWKMNICTWFWCTVPQTLHSWQFKKMNTKYILLLLLNC